MIGTFLVSSPPHSSISSEADSRLRSPGSQDGSSDNEMDETMRDADEGDGDADADNEPDADAEGDQEAESPSNTSHVSEGAGVAPQPSQDAAISPPHPTNVATDLISAFHPPVRSECLNASTFDIVPTTAAPHSTSINAVTATADMRWVFSGGSDGYVRKFNWVESINSKLMLTVAQRHPFVDSVIKAGVLMTYWENMDGNSLSPVYSLASHSEGLWLLTGLESGAIRLQTVRHEEGRELAVLHQHTSAVSSMTLTSDEKSLLSGSWDKRVFDWDLNTGHIRRSFGGSVRQISALQIRPESSIPVPSDTTEEPQPNGTFSSNNQAGVPENYSFMNTSNDQGDYGYGSNQQPGSPADSLFGGADSLFGDGDGGAGDGNGPSGHPFGFDEDDEFSRALTNGAPPDQDTQGEADNMDQSNGVTGHPPVSGDTTTDPSQSHRPDSHGEELPNGISHPTVNGLGHAEPEPSAQNQDFTQSSQADSDIGSDNTFLAASIDGTIRVWDRRQQDCVARITPYNSPPWCTNACWSPDGNYIYAGRRNGTVEEFSLHKGLRTPERVFKFPQGSGPVTAVKAMPNGRHIVW